MERKEREREREKEREREREKIREKQWRCLDCFEQRGIESELFESGAERRWVATRSFDFQLRSQRGDLLWRRFRHFRRGTEKGL